MATNPISVKRLRPDGFINTPAMTAPSAPPRKAPTIDDAAVPNIAALASLTSGIGIVLSVPGIGTSVVVRVLYKASIASCICTGSLAYFAEPSGASVAVLIIHSLYAGPIREESSVNARRAIWVFETPDLVRPTCSCIKPLALITFLGTNPRPAKNISSAGTVTSKTCPVFLKRCCPDPHLKPRPEPIQL